MLYWHNHEHFRYLWLTTINLIVADNRNLFTHSCGGCQRPQISITSWNQGVTGPHSLQRLEKIISSWLLELVVVIDIPWLIATSVSTSMVLLPSLLSDGLLPLLYGQWFHLGPTQIIQDNLPISRSLTPITSTKTLSPNKVLIQFPEIGPPIAGCHYADYYKDFFF